MEKCKTKAIQADVGMFTHIRAYSDIFKEKQPYSQAHSEPSVNLAYLESWHIQNPAKHLRWSIFAKIVNNYNYFHNISFSSSLLYEKYMIFLEKYLIFLMQVSCRSKRVFQKYLFDVKYGVRGNQGPTTVNF